jgi:hypothetical protein
MREWDIAPTDFDQKIIAFQAETVKVRLDPQFPLFLLTLSL